VLLTLRLEQLEVGVRQTHDRTKICTVVAFAAEGLGEPIPMRPYVKVGTIPKWVGTGRVLMHNHIRHSKDMPCGALPRMDRQHAAARVQALPVRMVRPAALQQDSRLQVRGEIEAATLGRISTDGRLQ